MSSFHAHDVIHMMLEANATFTRESLAQAITDKFGADAQFRSCSQEGMNVSGVIDFLESRGKFVPSGDGFSMDKNKICRH